MSSTDTLSLPSAAIFVKTCAHFAVSYCLDLPSSPSIEIKDACQELKIYLLPCLRKFTKYISLYSISFLPILFSRRACKQPKLLSAFSLFECCRNLELTMHVYCVAQQCIVCLSTATAGVKTMFKCNVLYDFSGLLSEVSNSL